MLKRIHAVLAVLVFVTILGTARSFADTGQDCHYQLVCENGECKQVLVCSGGAPGDPGTPGDPDGDTPGKPVCIFNGKNIPCNTEGGYWWSPAHQCYYLRWDPWPEGVFEEKKPEGAVYTYYCPPAPEGSWEYTWLPEAPPGYGAGGVNPEDLAARAIASMNLRAIDIGIVPEPGANSLGIVGMPTWMWVDRPTETTFGPISESVSAGGITVTATAEVEEIEWDMGDGTMPVTCIGPGTPYADLYGKEESPTCGHRYEKTSWSQPGHTFTVTARSYWRIDWAGAGQSGTIRLDPLQESVDLRVGEAQVLTQ